MDTKEYRKKYKICNINNLPIVEVKLDLVGEKLYDMVKIDNEFCFVGFDIVHPNSKYSDNWFISHFFSKE
jgi:hypothetical protein